MPLSKIQFGNTGRRNLLINGAMQVAQRGTSIAMAHDGNTSNYILDRWRISLGGTHEQLDGTFAQVADNPLGGNGKSLKWTTGTPESSYDADEYVYITQIVEAQNLHHIQNGNSNAKKLTLSFWVKSSITGTYAAALYKPDNTARIRNLTYTISSANTWEKKSVTFEGDTAGGGINNDSGQGFYVVWHLSTGSTYTGGGSDSAWVNYANNTWAAGQATNGVVTTAGATWLMTECQLEVGDSASDFEHRSFAEELALGQRYYYKSMKGDPANNIPTTDNPSSDGYHPWTFFAAQSARTPFFFHPQVMRAQPTVTLFSSTRANTANKMAIYNDGASSWGAVASNGATPDTQRVALYCTTSSSFSSSRSYLLAGGYQCDAEL